MLFSQQVHCRQVLFTSMNLMHLSLLLCWWDSPLRPGCGSAGTVLWLGFSPAGSGQVASADSGKQNSRILSYRYHWRCGDKPGGGVGAGRVAEGCGEPGRHRGNLSSGPVSIFRTNMTPGVSAANLKQRFFLPTYCTFRLLMVWSWFHFLISFCIWCLNNYTNYILLHLKTIIIIIHEKYLINSTVSPSCQTSPMPIQCAQHYYRL